MLPRRNAVPHFLALSDSTQHLVRALQALAATGKQDEAEAILQEELKIAPTDAALQSLLHSFHEVKK